MSDEVLVRVEGVSKKFCRSLKKSLWYGVCDIAGELLPGRKRRETRVEGRELSGRSAQDISRSPLDAGLLTAAASALGSRPSSLVSPKAPPSDWVYALKDVSFEVKRGELRTLGRSEKEISKKCLGATKVPDSGRRRHQLLGLIGHNGAGNQAAGQQLGRLPQAARRVRRRGKARINTTLLKMLNGLIKPDAGTITMRGRVGALIALGAGFNPILTGREPEGWEARRKSNRRLARRVQRRREGANQNIYINGSVLRLTKKETSTCFRIHLN